MPTWAWIIIIIIPAAVVVLAAIAATVGRRRRSEHLQERFGPEYERSVADRGDQRAAERELADRERKREQLDIVPLSAEARSRYAESWRTVQTRFVDDPSGAVVEADRLVADVMRERGYPIDDFDQRAADISVDHPDVVENYRSAHDIFFTQERARQERKTCGRPSSTTALCSRSYSRLPSVPPRRLADGIRTRAAS